MTTICIQVELELTVPMLMIDRKSDTLRHKLEQRKSCSCAILTSLPLLPTDIKKGFLENQTTEMFTTNLLQVENEVGAWEVIPRPEAMKAYMEARRRGKRQKPGSQKIALLQTAIQGWTCRLPYLPIVPATYNFISQHPAADNFLTQAWESMSSNHSVPI